MSLSKTLRELREQKGLTQEEVAQRLDPPYTSGAVTAWESGRANPRLAIVYQLAHIFDVSVYDLLDSPEGSAMVGKSAFLPLVASAHMGDFNSEDSDRLVEVPASIVDRHPSAFVVRGIGDCMNKQFPEDCVLVVDPDLPPRNGEAVLVESEDYQAMVRTFMKGNDTLILSANSFNEYEDIVVRPSDPPVKVLGVVVWYQASQDVNYG